MRGVFSVGTVDPGCVFPPANLANRDVEGETVSVQIHSCDTSGWSGRQYRRCFCSGFVRLNETTPSQHYRHAPAQSFT